MVTRPNLDVVSGVLLFAGLSTEEHERLRAIALVERFEAGAAIFREGDPPGDLYVMLGGRVTLSMRIPGQPDRSVLSLRSGELLGWTALIGKERVATALAVLPSELLRLPRSDLLMLCESDHDVGYAIMRQAFEEMADRLVQTRLQLLDMFGPPRR